MHSSNPYDTGLMPMMMTGSSPTYNSRSALTPPSYGGSQASFGAGSHGSFGNAGFPNPLGNHSSFVAAAPPTVVYPSPTQQRSFTDEPPQTSRLLPTKPMRECDDECAEEECLDADQCGAENRPPKPENLVCGIDTRPLLPIGLAVSTIIGGLTMMLVQLPLLCRLVSISETSVSTVGLVLYGITLGCMCYCAFGDPGQMAKGRGSSDWAMSGDLSPEAPMPKRAHTTWQYKRPIRRYDHYCRWLSNCIGLLNHREFVVMLVGLVVIAVLGSLVDAVLALSMLSRGFWIDEMLVVLHLIYSIGMLALAYPILRIHVGLVSRNELAAEWKRNDFYVAEKSKKGENVSVNELSDDEFNHLFDHFVYDRRKNAFDRGWWKNCVGFWCRTRWSAEQTGEF